MLTRDLIARLPKAELHVHFDGSLRPETVLDLAREADVAVPGEDAAALAQYMLVDDARDLEGYLQRFNITIALLQTAQGIERVAYEMVEDAARDNLRYLEVRYCPVLSTAGGLTMDQVLDAQLAGFARGERDFGVTTRLINCALRHHEPSVSAEVAEVSVAYRDRGVVGFDLAGPEAGRPPSVHREAFTIARRGYLGITVHAGEAAGADSIAEAVFECDANRLGHGTRLFENSDLLAYVRDRRILIEVNLTSNVQTHAVARAEEHPVRDYFDRGVKVTLSTDSWLMSGVSLTDEYWLAHRALAFSRQEIDQMILNAFRGSFLPWPERATLLAAAEAELAGIA